MMKLIFLISALCVMNYNIMAQSDKFFTSTKVGYDLVWKDEFNGSILDTTKWSHRLPGERYDAINCAEAVSVNNGNLIISTYTKTVTGSSKNYTGMILSKEKFKYGYFEARIKLSTIRGMWSAFWIQSPTVADQPYEPEKRGVEIDIMEHRQHDWKETNIENMIGCALHWNGYGCDHAMVVNKTIAPGVMEGFHTYGMEWDETGYYFYYDGKLINSWLSFEVPISKVFQGIIFSSEVRDNNWAGKIPSLGYGDIHETNAKMVVDYVRVYKRK
ncbi:glycoside hydrolase family 16 protein [Bacteroides ovatus]|uniref:glycoside hydrolase family 16 protein n=1 Tax=Bacteroides ovatus TaxID=28116 RepID=UPI000E539922|nr:glycoside hydrolase family 16 protein [Bacteroides ovatus]RGQ76106.1 glycoside hydrolase family 16 protein [Bacteroides ovatus]